MLNYGSTTTSIMSALPLHCCSCCYSYYHSIMIVFASGNKRVKPDLIYIVLIGCMSGTPIDYVNSTDIPMCRHSTPLYFLQNTRCSTHTYHSRQRKFSCLTLRTTCVEQFTGYEKTDHQLRQHLKTDELRA